MSILYLAEVPARRCGEPRALVALDTELPCLWTCTEHPALARRRSTPTRGAPNTCTHVVEAARRLPLDIAIRAAQAVAPITRHTIPNPAN